MSEPLKAYVEPEGEQQLLAERMRPAIYEATTGIGSHLTQLVQHTVQHGVRKVDEQLVILIDERLDAAVGDRMPEFEEAARVAAGQRLEELEQQIRHLIQQSESSMTHRLSEVAQHAELTSATLRERLNVLHEAVSELSARLIEEQKVRQHAVVGMREEVRQFCDSARKRTNETVYSQYKEVKSLVEALEARVEILERPRGLKALFQRLCLRAA